MKGNDSSVKRFFKIRKNELCGFVTEFKNEHWWQLFPVSRGKYPFVIEVPDGVKIIKENAFLGLRAGINGEIFVKLPSGVERIEKNAFSGCEISKLFICDTVTYIDPDAFRLSKIGEIEVDKANLQFKSENGSLYDYDMNILIRYAGTDTEYTVARSVSVIGKRAFENSTRLECIYIPETVLTICDGAFYNSGIKSVSGADAVTSLGQHVFALCKSLRSFMMPSAITTVNHRLFYGCESLETITISPKTTQIGEEAFYLCTSLSEIELGDEIKIIGKGAFDGCRALRTVSIPPRVTTIEERTFKGCAISEMTIHDAVNKVGKEAFSDCRRLKTVTVGAGVNEMAEHVFFGCNKNITVVLRGFDKEQKLPFDRKWNTLSIGFIFDRKIKNVAYLSIKS